LIILKIIGFGEPSNIHFSPSHKKLSQWIPYTPKNILIYALHQLMEYYMIGFPELNITTKQH